MTKKRNKGGFVELNVNQDNELIVEFLTEKNYENIMRA